MNFNINSSKPSLTEPGVKYFLNQTLKQCHEFKTTHYNLLLNISVFIGFLIILGGLLLYKYKGKLTDEQKKYQDKIKEQYILDKIRNLKNEKQKAQQTLITGLPHWETD